METHNERVSLYIPPEGIAKVADGSRFVLEKFATGRRVRLGYTAKKPFHRSSLLFPRIVRFNKIPLSLSLGEQN
jgi:hypothetical protein